MPIVNAWGVVLSRRDLGEADRLCTIYTENLGKLPVRFVGVNKPGRKMKALSEPLVWAEYRLYLSPRSDYGKAVGGQLISSFPEAREDLSRMVAALSCCELVERLTAERDPSPEKYRGLSSALALICHGGSAWVPLAFGLQTLALAGHGLRAARPAYAPEGLWLALHDAELGALGELPYERELESRLTELMTSHVEAQTGRALKTKEFVRQLSASSAATAPEAVH